jgi:hypothetical protein
MLASSTKHKTGDPKKPTRKRNTKEEKPQRNCTQKEKEKRETTQNSKSMILKISWVLASSPIRIEKPWKAF